MICQPFLSQSASGKLSKQSSHSSTSSGRGRTPERESSPSPAVITGSVRLLINTNY